MKKLLLGLVLFAAFLLADKYFNKKISEGETMKTATIETRDTTFTTKVEVTYPAGVGEKVYTAKETKGKIIIAKVEMSGKLKPKDERNQKSGYISPRVTYLLLNDSSMVVCKKADVLAPITEEAALALINN
jgi:hypothetical protein